MRVGEHLAGRYRLLGVLGRGGSATTWRARDELSGQEVALKLLATARTPHPGILAAEFSRLSRLSHPRLVRVHDFGVERRGQRLLCFYTAEQIDGRSLFSAARGSRWDELCGPIVDALDALGFLHRVGLVHGDFKPDNVLVSGGRATLIDLGCARPIGSLTDDVSGTLDWIAPEVLAGAPADARADLFAVGRCLVALGEELALPPEVAALAERSTRPNPRDRPADVGELLDVLGAPERANWLAPIAATTLHGRERELGRLEAALDALSEHRRDARAFAITGSAGVGKTRLMREIRSRAQLSITVQEAGVGGGGIRGACVRAGCVTAGETALNAVELAERVLAAARARGMPLLFVVDDVDRLPADERKLIESVMRLLEPDDPLLVVVTATEPLVLGGRVELLALEPLTASDVARWGDGIVSQRAAAEIARVSAGRPAEIESLLARIVSGATTEQRLERSADVEQADPQRAHEIASLPSELVRALCVCARFAEPISSVEAEALGVAPEALVELAARGLLLRQADQYRLARAGDAERAAAALGAELTEIDRSLLAYFERSDRSIDAARALVQRCRLGDVERALSRAGEWVACAGDAPRAWCEAARELARFATPECLRVAGELFAAAARPDEAERCLAAIQPPAAATLVTMAGLRLRRGDAPSALAALELASEQAVGGEERASILELQARATIKLGDAQAAVALAERGLDSEPDPATRAALHEDLGVALSYLGQHERAESELSRAEALCGASADPRAHVRVTSSAALEHFRAGRTRAALDGYRRVLELCERHALDDQLAAAALNVGTAQHQLGEWGPALEAYERGFRSARALGQASTWMRLAFNLGKLYADIGAFERASGWAERAEHAAEAAGQTFLVAAAASLNGEIASNFRDFARAERELTRALELFGALAASRELAEVELERTELELARADRGAAEQALARARATDPSAGDDLLARISIAEARLALQAGDAARAVEHAETASEIAARAAQRELEAQAELTLFQSWSARGASEIAARHRARARELWERAATSLPQALQSAFWEHPSRRGAREIPEAPASPLREHKLWRLIDVNRRLAAALDTERVLGLAMDAAIELTGAERGFVILASERGLQVAVAKNFDRERIGKRHVKFSRGIAERVIESGEPMLTVDASADERLRHAVSVHAMKLRSVLCVPVRSSERVLGALYLDNRFAQARFGTDDVDLLLAFADQTAIAIVNAQLHAELVEKSKQLEAERRRVEELARGQAEQIDRLSAEVRAQREVLVLRHDYGKIVGKSPAMRRVLGTLDRVIDSGVSVLVSGESGTGKELVARAVHFNGPTRSGPFVSLNCAALPDTLLESELFGHKKGAFTGADRDREGLMVSARGGTLFLDELGETSPGMQVKLLRALQEREVRPLGATRSVSVDFRLICATNRDLGEEVRLGRFREDLYYRVGVVEVRLPPLRERREDVPELARELLARIAAELGKPGLGLSRAALKKLLSHDFPGNVRELENVLTKAAVLCETSEISAEELELGADPRSGAPVRSRAQFRDVELSKLQATLRATRFNVSEAARRLGISRATLYRRLRRAGIATGDA